MDVHDDTALQVPTLPVVAGDLPRPFGASTNADTRSNPLKPATRGSSSANNYMFKTGLCRNFWSTGKCRFGDRCMFAHGSEEITSSKAVNLSTSKRQICRFSWGKCPYGERCIFQHKRMEKYGEKRDMPLKNDAVCILPDHGCDGSRYKTRLCNNWSMLNSCSRGSNCNYAHGQAELRTTAAPVLASEPRNARLAPMASVKDALPNHGQKETASKHKLPPRVCLFKWKKFKKIASIYADWIDDESCAPCDFSELT